MRSRVVGSDASRSPVQPTGHARRPAGRPQFSAIQCEDVRRARPVGICIANIGESIAYTDSRIGIKISSRAFTIWASQNHPRFRSVHCHFCCRIRECFPPQPCSVRGIVGATPTSPLLPTDQVALYTELPVQAQHPGFTAKRVVRARRA